MKRVLVVLAGIVSTVAFTFPEMIRHRYTSCLACHVSPDGGGVLTSYGRSLSKEVLATWGEKGEENFLYGAVKLPEWLELQAEARFVQTIKDTPTYREGRFLYMQGDLEAAATIKSLTGVATIGYQDVSGTHSAIDNVISRRHYLSYRLNDNVLLRAGRFFHAYGIRVPDHVLEIKRGLGWDYSTETYNVEGSYISEKAEVFVTGILGRLDSPSLNREKGASARASYLVGETARLGVSYYFGTNNTRTRQVFGPFAVIGFTPKTYLLAEIDLQASSPKLTQKTFGAVSYLRFGYEAVKGLHLFTAHEFAQTNFSSGSTERNGLGGGVRWFPRPHFEFEGNYQYQWSPLATRNKIHYLWFMLHAWL